MHPLYLRSSLNYTFTQKKSPNETDFWFVMEVIFIIDANLVRIYVMNLNWKSLCQDIMTSWPPRNACFLWEAFKNVTSCQKYLDVKIGAIFKIYSLFEMAIQGQLAAHMRALLILGPVFCLVTLKLVANTVNPPNVDKIFHSSSRCDNCIVFPVLYFTISW